MPFQITDEVFQHMSDHTDHPQFATAKVNDENKEQYRARIYAANRALDLHDLEMQLFGETYDGEYWSLRGRYGENDINQLKAEAVANVLANPEYDDEYPLNNFYNDLGFEDVDWEDETEPLDSAWGYQRQYFEWFQPANCIETGEITFLCQDLPEEYIAAMDAQ